jgi:hypothetical protein
MNANPVDNNKLMGCDSVEEHAVTDRISALSQPGRS